MPLPRPPRCRLWSKTRDAACLWQGVFWYMNRLTHVGDQVEEYWTSEYGESWACVWNTTSQLEGVAWELIELTLTFSCRGQVLGILEEWESRP